ncbi:hypothetical protein IKS57_04660 [bacterium]|nr:hypothetical protein [bacterium]
MQFSDFTNTGYTSNIGESEINVNISNAVNNLGNAQSEVGWELTNSSDSKFNNDFVQLNLSVINTSAYSFTITP